MNLEQIELEKQINEFNKKKYIKRELLETKIKALLEIIITSADSIKKEANKETVDIAALQTKLAFLQDFTNEAKEEAFLICRAKGIL